MMSRQDAILTAALGAQGFLTENQASLTSVDLTAARKRLDDVISSFTTHAYNQDAHNRSAQGETEKQGQIRLKLRSEFMAPIAEIARRSLNTVPEFKELRMPRRSAKGQAFLASAKAMVDAATKYKDELLARGLPADSLDQFQALLTTFGSSVGGRQQNRVQRIGATTGLANEDKEARSVLKVLDGLVRRALDGNAALLGAWVGARTIHYKSGGPTKAKATATTPTTTPTAPTTAPSTQATPVEAPASSTPASPTPAAA